MTLPLLSIGIPLNNEATTRSQGAAANLPTAEQAESEFAVALQKSTARHTENNSTHTRTTSQTELPEVATEPVVATVDEASATDIAGLGQSDTSALISHNFSPDSEVIQTATFETASLVPAKSADLEQEPATNEPNSKTKSETKIAAEITSPTGLSRLLQQNLPAGDSPVSNPNAITNTRNSANQTNPLVVETAGYETDQNIAATHTAANLQNVTKTQTDGVSNHVLETVAASETTAKPIDTDNVNTNSTQTDAIQTAIVQSAVPQAAMTASVSVTTQITSAKSDPTVTIDTAAQHDGTQAPLTPQQNVAVSVSQYNTYAAVQPPWQQSPLQPLHIRSAHAEPVSPSSQLNSDLIIHSAATTVDASLTESVSSANIAADSSKPVLQTVAQSSDSPDAKFVTANQTETTNTQQTTNNTASATQTSGTADSQAERVELVSRITQSMQSAQQSGKQISMRLHPAELGSMQIEVAMQDGQLTAHLQVESEATQQIIMENLPALHDALAQNGNTIDRIHVVLKQQPGDEQSSQNQQSQSQEHNHKQQQQRQSNRSDEQEQFESELAKQSNLDRLDIQL